MTYSSIQVTFFNISWYALTLFHFLHFLFFFYLFLDVRIILTCWDWYYCDHLRVGSLDALLNALPCVTTLYHLHYHLCYHTFMRNLYHFLACFQMLLYSLPYIFHEISSYLYQPVTQADPNGKLDQFCFST